jgi:hypothetical protein
VILVQTDVGLPENARDVVQLDDFLLQDAAPYPIASGSCDRRTNNGTGCTSYCRRSTVYGYSTITLTDYEASERSLRARHAGGSRSSVKSMCLSTGIRAAQRRAIEHANDFCCAERASLSYFCANR